MDLRLGNLYLLTYCGPDAWRGPGCSHAFLMIGYQDERESTPEAYVIRNRIHLEIEWSRLLWRPTRLRSRGQWREMVAMHAEGRFPAREWDRAAYVVDQRGKAHRYEYRTTEWRAE